MAKLKLKKGDQVIVIAGKDKGKKGEVLKALPAENKVIVSGINQAKKHQRPTHMQAGGIITKDMPIHVSNVALLDPKEDKATRVGYKILEDGTKTRFAKLSGEDVA